MHTEWFVVKLYGNFRKRFEENGWEEPPFFNFEYDYFDTYDCTLFDYITTVFDASDNITMTDVVKKTDSLKGNGVTCYDYITQGGIEFTLTLYGGFPIPEVSSYNLTCREFSDELINEIRIAFGQYFRTEFKICEHKGTALRMYETEEDKIKHKENSL